MRLYLRFAYQFRRLNRPRVATLLGAEGERLSSLCDAIDYALPPDEKRRFAFTGLGHSGRDLVVCWEIDDEDLNACHAVFDGELAEHRAELLRNLPRLTDPDARAILTHRSGCARLP